MLAAGSLGVMCSGYRSRARPRASAAIMLLRGWSASAGRYRYRNKDSASTWLAASASRSCMLVTSMGSLCRFFQPIWRFYPDRPSGKRQIAWAAWDGCSRSGRPAVGSFTSTPWPTAWVSTASARDRRVRRLRGAYRQHAVPTRRVHVRPKRRPMLRRTHAHLKPRVATLPLLDHRLTEWMLRTPHAHKHRRSRLPALHRPCTSLAAPRRPHHRRKTPCFDRSESWVTGLLPQEGGS